MVSRSEHSKVIAEQVIKALEEGTAPWVKPWRPGTLKAPFNPTTGKPYRGINNIMLSLGGFGDPRWMTFNQAKAEGFRVRKGSKGTQIIYVKRYDEKVIRDEKGKPIKDEDGNSLKERTTLSRPGIFRAVVFNAEQIDGIEPWKEPVDADRNEFEIHQRCEAILQASGAKILHSTGGEAYYNRFFDEIHLPGKQRFHAADGYYSTALHELGHWTGHESRLARPTLLESTSFGSETYAKEELRAELSSMLVGQTLEIGHDPGQHIAYVGSWIKVLKDDPTELMAAATDAQKIHDYVMAFEAKTTATEGQSLSLTALDTESKDFDANLGISLPDISVESSTTQSSPVSVPAAMKLPTSQKQTHSL